MDIKLSDVTLHIQEDLDKAQRGDIEAALRALEGVVSVHYPDDRSHLAIVEYNPDRTSSKAVLANVRANGLHAQLIGI
jgi:hypothetical protein